ncbi:MAG: hypothetical protein ACOC2U_02540 [bacterium]
MDYQNNNIILPGFQLTDTNLPFELSQYKKQLQKSEQRVTGSIGREYKELEKRIVNGEIGLKDKLAIAYSLFFENENATFPDRINEFVKQGEPIYIKSHSDFITRLLSDFKIRLKYHQKCLDNCKDVDISDDYLVDEISQYGTNEAIQVSEKIGIIQNSFTDIDNSLETIITNLSDSNTKSHASENLMQDMTLLLYKYLDTISQVKELVKTYPLELENTFSKYQEMVEVQLDNLYFGLKETNLTLYLSEFLRGESLKIIQNH